MRRWLPLLAAALWLSACAHTPAPPTSGNTSASTSGTAPSGTPGPPAVQPATPPVPPVTVPVQGGEGPPTQPAGASPTVQRQPGHVILRATDGMAQAALSPGAQQVALLWVTHDAKEPALALGVLPVQADGPVHELTRFPHSPTGPLPSPMLAGWLDDQRVVVITAALQSDGPAQRAEVWDTRSGQRTSASAWVAVAGKGQLNWPQTWLAGSGDTARVLFNNGSIWRLDPVGGQAEQLFDQVPPLKHVGAVVAPSPDHWRALYGGGMNQARQGVVDLRTGQNRPLPEAWKRMVWGQTGHLLALTNTEEHPGQVLIGYDGAWDFYSTVVVASADGQVQRQLPLPPGLLIANAHETSAGWLVVETVRLTKDAAEKEFGYRVDNGPLLTAGPTDPALRPLWEWPGRYGPGTPKPWLLAGNWLLVDHQQIPLAGGKTLPWPDGVQVLVPVLDDPTKPPLPPLVVGDGSVRSIFTAGQTQTYALGSAAEQRPVQLEAARDWVAVWFYGDNSRSEVHLVQMAQ